MTRFRPVFLALAAASLASPALAQGIADGYSDHATLRRSIDRLRGDHSNLVQVEVITASPGGREVQAITIGSGDELARRPALLIVANAFGPHLVGSEVAMRIAANLAASYGSDSTVTALLDSKTVYVIPRANPDAAEAMFRSPLAERSGNDSASDDDNDWQVNEDGPEDLNGDGVITQMRVSDPAGDWLADAANPALMRRADRTKGESGAYRLYTEGRDNDGDEAFNEDPAGGVNVNANFTYGYEFFTAGAGEHQMSSVEARAIADFVIAHESIAAVYVLGPQDNLMTPWKHRESRGIGGNAEGTSAGGPYSSILAADEPYFERMSERFRELTGLSEGPESAAIGGDVLSWAYYHIGRWAFGSRTWWIPEMDEGTEIDDDADAEGDDGDEDPGEEGRGEDEDMMPEKHESLTREYNDYNWLTQNRPSGFVEWTPVQHPDFPDRQVEVGGFAPFVRLNPPASMLDSIAEGHEAFVVELGRALPELTFRNVRVENVGTRTYRVSTEIANDGYFPTLSAIGTRVFWPRRIRVELGTDGQEIVGGRAIQLVGAVEGSGASSEISWLVVGSAGSRVTLSAVSPVAGSISQTITLR